jgi:hypothetical protein
MSNATSKNRTRKSRSAQAILEEALTAALDRDGIEIKPNGKDATVRAVRKDTVRLAFKAAYLAEHPDANNDAVSRAWQRALRQAKTTVMKGTVDGVPYLWRGAPSS